MYLPSIENNAFFTNTASQILRPDPFPFNDHCFFCDHNKVWHFIYQHYYAQGGSSILTPMNMIGDFANVKTDPRKGDLWAPCSVVSEDTLYVFFADTIINIKDSWKEFIAYVHRGNAFRMWAATAPLGDVSKLELKAVLFEDNGGARDPFVFWYAGLKQWIMLYAKRVDPTSGVTGESAIAYRMSPDLLRWSEFKGYVIRDLYYEDEIRDQVAEAIGNAESPFLIEYEGMYYLFVTHVGFRQYHRTNVWISPDPLNFKSSKMPDTVLYAHAPEIINDNGQWFISNCGIHHKEFGEEGQTARIPGVEIAKLKWNNI